MQSYHGKKPYIFFSYCHQDQDEVYYIAEKMIENGYRIWFDDAISLTEPFDDNIATYLRACEVFLIFLSPSYLQSEYCDMELKYAKRMGHKIATVYLENTDLSIYLGMEMILGSDHELFKFKMTNEVFFEKLISANVLKDCKAAGEEEVSAIVGDSILTETPKSINVFWSLFPLGAIVGSLYIVKLQTRWLYFRQNWLIIAIQMLLALLGFALLMSDHKRYSHRTSRTTLPGFLSLLVLGINLAALILRIPHGEIGTQIGTSIFCASGYGFYLLMIYYNKPNSINHHTALLSGMATWLITTLLMIQWYGEEYRYSAMIQFLWISFHCTFGITDTTEFDSFASVRKQVYGTIAFLFLLLAIIELIFFPKIYYFFTK